MGTRINKQLVCGALYYGIFFDFDNKLIGSMSRLGNCWDNAISESFFHTLKVELINQHCYLTKEEAKSSIFQYIEGYYNKKRIHSDIDYKTPYEVEYICKYA